MLKRLVAAAALALAPGCVTAETLSFVVLGDMPYGPPERVYPPYAALIDRINAIDPDLVIHVGDTKSGGAPCSDELLSEQLDFLERFEAPTLYTPGDNEWTDCHRTAAGGFDPVERLAYIRRTYFADPGRSFGAERITVRSQAAGGYPENVRAMLGDVMFVTAHVVGSNNNLEPRPAAAREHFARDAANIRWLRASFAEAAQARAVVLAIHADMFEFAFGPPWDPEGFLRHSGFKRFGEALVEEANAFGRPVLLVFGDSHRFRMFRPFRKTAPTVMALETFGARHMHAVQVDVTPSAAFPFAVRPVINPARPVRPADGSE
ncbi:metallophosphoesterase family protein [Roseovarius salinarum]|uniref:metallophosphoesterase family protein n=1 Tax=Roseovarius salinarum TaxID=1981892 RepID=UPI000C33AE8B|nr:metallophosphoesterase [Roseovarius salinarum]